MTLTWTEAGVVGLVQGVSELFPISSLGHSVLLPALVGGSWARDLDVSKAESPYLAYIVGLHVATAIALLIYFRRYWVRVVGGLISAIRTRRVETTDQRLAVALILATIPVGITGLLFEHLFRTVFGKPLSAAAFLAANGLLLIGGELLRKRQPSQADSGQDERITDLGFRQTTLIGASQIFALFAGISRSGAAMVTGLARGLDHEDAARFSFLLATPVILAAGALKIPDLLGPLGDGIRGQVAFGAVLSGVGAYLSVRFLTRYFHNRSLLPFGAYCLVAGALCVVRFA